MKKLVVIVVMVVMPGLAALAQWTQTSGPTGATLFSMAANAGTTMAFTSGGVWVYKDGSWGRTGEAIYVTESTLTSNHAFGIAQQKFLRSDDMGATWEEVTLPTDTLPISVSGWGSYVYIVSGQTLFRSNDGGMTWERRGSTGFFMTVDAIGEETLIGVQSFFGSTPKTVSRSVDGGMTWIDLNEGIPGSPLSVEAVSVSNNHLFVEVDDVLYVSSDQGITWILAAPGTEVLTSATMQLADMRSADDIWLLIQRSVSDGGMAVHHFNGSTWELNMEIGYDVVSSINVSDGMIIGRRSDIQKLDTRSGSWSDLDATLRASTNVGFASIGSAVLTTAADGVWRTTNVGAMWDHVRESSATAIVADDSVFYTLGASIERSTDLGTTWERLDTLIRDQTTGDPIHYPTSIATGLGSVWVTEGFFNRQEHGQGGGWLVGGVYRSDDHGRTWINVSSNLPFDGITTTPVMQVFTNENYVTILTASGLFRSADRGGSWVRMPLEPAASGTNGYALYGRKDQIILAVGYSELHRSFDGGATWEYLGRLPDSVAVTENWNYAGGGISLVDNDLYVTALRTSKIDSTSFLYEPQVYRFTGTSIENITAQLPSGMTFRSFFKHNNSILAGTEGRSVWINEELVSTVNEQPTSDGPQLRVSPLPVASSAMVQVSLNSTQQVTIQIVDQLGARISTLHHGWLSAGTTRIPLNMVDLPAGIYYIMLTCNNKMSTERVLKL